MVQDLWAKQSGLYGNAELTTQVVSGNIDLSVGAVIYSINAPEVRTR